jgi:hypothetical protein
MADHFDYDKMAREANLSPAQLEVIKQGVRLEYPLDQMLFELHVLRACRVIRDGLATFDDVVRTLPGHASAA